MKAIEAVRETALKSLRDEVASDLGSTANTISDQQARALEERLRQVVAEVSKRDAEVRSAETKRDRILNGLPEQVELDQLNDYYAELWKNASGYLALVQTFNTALGSIGFGKGDFTRV